MHFFLFTFGCGKKSEGKVDNIASNKAKKSKKTGEIIFIASSQDFDEILSNNALVLVDFYADWCGPCHMLKPTIKEIARDYEGRVKVITVDIDKFRTLAGQFNINSIPDVKLFREGSLERSFMGVQPKQSYTQVIDSLL